jgi:hypothetical protein
VSTLPTGLAGLFLYQSGSVYVDFPLDVVKRQVALQRNDATTIATWTELLPRLTYWHECDHFCSFITSPYFHAADAVLTWYARGYTALFQRLKREGITSVDAPLAELKSSGRISASAEEQVRELRWAKEAIAHIFSASPSEPFVAGNRRDDGGMSFAATLNELMRRVAADLKVGTRGAPIADPAPTDFVESASTVASSVAVLEASAVFHESGNLAELGIRDDRWGQWFTQRLGGIYASLFPHLMTRFDVDIVGVLLKYALRGSFFPFLRPPLADVDTSRMTTHASLRDIHPGYRVEAGARTLANKRMCRLPSECKESPTQEARFYDDVAAVLRDELAPVCSEEPFAATDYALNRSLMDEAPDLYDLGQRELFAIMLPPAWGARAGMFQADPGGIEARLHIWERGRLNRKRAAIFEAEKATLATVFSGPIETPLRVIYSDGRGLFAEDAIDQRPLLAFDSRGITVGVGEAVVLGASETLDVLCAVLGRFRDGVGTPTDVVAETLKQYDLHIGG